MSAWGLVALLFLLFCLHQFCTLIIPPIYLFCHQPHLHPPFISSSIFHTTLGATTTSHSFLFHLLFIHTHIYTPDSLFVFLRKKSRSTETNPSLPSFQFLCLQLLLPFLSLSLPLSLLFFILCFRSFIVPLSFRCRRSLYIVFLLSFALLSFKSFF